MARRALASRSRGFQRPQRQPTNWARLVSTVGIVVAANTKILSTTIVLSNPGIGETVRRTRGVIAIASDQGAVVEDQLGAFGMVVVSDLALAAGAASIPGPGTDASDDGWFVWRPFVGRGDSSNNRVAFNFEFDSKAMRRVEEGFGIAIMVENTSAATGLVISFAVSLLSSLS